jgi:hypothetical protein
MKYYPTRNDLKDGLTLERVIKDIYDKLPDEVVQTAPPKVPRRIAVNPQTKLRPFVTQGSTSKTT